MLKICEEAEQPNKLISLCSFLRVGNNLAIGDYALCTQIQAWETRWSQLIDSPQKPDWQQTAAHEPF